MRLSEAIRAGAKMSKQYFGTYENAGGDTCALGAAWRGINSECEAADFRLFNAFPILEAAGGCPLGCIVHVYEGSKHTQIIGNVFMTVYHLNDFHKMSREAIAEWVEVIENKLEPHPPCAEVDQASSGNAVGKYTDASTPTKPVLST